MLCHGQFSNPLASKLKLVNLLNSLLQTIEIQHTMYVMVKNTIVVIAIVIYLQLEDGSVGDIYLLIHVCVLTLFA